MTRPRPWLAALALVVACRGGSSTAPEPPAPPPRPVAAAPVQRVVIPWDVPLYRTASATGRRIELVNPDGPPPPPKYRQFGPPPRDPDALIWPGPGYVLEVVADHGEFLAVTPVPGDDGACTATMPGVDAWAVVFHVERAALHRVVTRALTVDFADGTAATLAPGVTVGVEVGRDPARGAVDYTIETDGVRMVVPLPADAIGERYVGEPAFELPHDANRGIREYARIGYDGGRVLDRLPPSRGYDPVRAVAGARVLGLQRVEVTRRCLQLRVDIDERRLGYARAGRDAPYDDGWRYLGERGGVEVEYRARRDAPLTWPDGEPAGRVRDRGDRRLADPRFEAGNVCFDLAPSHSWDWRGDGPRLHAWTETLTLCIAPADLEPEVTVHAARRTEYTGAGYRFGGGRPAPPAPAPPRPTHEPILTIGPVAVEGPYHVALIDRVVAAAGRHLLACVDRNGLGPGFGGSFTVAFAVAYHGHAEGAVAERSTLADARVPVCVANIIDQLRFPEHDGSHGIRAVVPLTLAARPIAPDKR